MRVQMIMDGTSHQEFSTLVLCLVAFVGYGVMEVLAAYVRIWVSK